MLSCIVTMHMHCNVYKHNDIITNITLCIHKLRNAQSLNYRPSLSPLLKKDNLHIKDKMPAPDLSVIRRFHCNHSTVHRLRVHLHLHSHIVPEHTFSDCHGAIIGSQCPAHTHGKVLNEVTV